MFDILPDPQHPVVQNGETSILHFDLPAERFLLVTGEAALQGLVDKLAGQAQLTDSRQWLALNIEAGLAVIDSANCNQFIPQAVNLQALGGISFDKGCYAGQEMVARAKYRAPTNGLFTGWPVKQVISPLSATFSNYSLARTGAVPAPCWPPVSWRTVRCGCRRY